MGREYGFRIGAYTPDTIPMERLAAYMAHLATLVGFPEKVHFKQVERGSALLKYWIDDTVSVNMEDRVRTAQSGAGPKDAVQGFQSINRLLVEDDSDGQIEDNAGAEIIQFPGAKIEPEREIHGFGQRDTLDGVVQRIGRKGLEASVTLESRDGQQFTAALYKHVAQKLAAHIFGAEVRLHGWAKWRRTRDGVWLVDSFKVSSFEVLDEKSLSEVIADLRAVEGSDWNNFADPWAELSALRNGDAEIAQ